MFDRKLNIASLALVVASGALLLGAQPVLACHEPTGMCCVDDDHDYEEGEFCCWFEGNEMGNCGPILDPPQ